VPCSDVDQQSAFVASRILELRDDGTPLEDIAVMYRSHYHSIELQLELSRRNIPYRIQSCIRFFEQAHIKDVISYLRIIVNPRDELSWKRVLKMIPGVGNKTAARLYDLLASTAETQRRGDGQSVLLSLNEESEANPNAMTRLSDALQAGRLRSSRPLKDFVELLEILTSQENRNNPTKQIR
jgi:superfamily I DNA/RNA helicase